MTVEQVGSGRLRRVVAVGPGGVRADGSFYDTKLATGCYFFQIQPSSAPVYCFPSTDASVSSNAYFSDATCQTPLRLAFQYYEQCGAAPKYAYEWKTVGCNVASEIYRLGPELPASTRVYMKTSGGTCHEQSSASVRSGGNVVYTLAARVPTAELAQATITP